MFYPTSFNYTIDPRRRSKRYHENNFHNYICVTIGRCCKPYPWFARIAWFAWRFDAHWVIAMDIPIRHGYFVFRVVLRPRIMQSAWDIAPLAQSIISIVVRIASWKEPYHYYGFRAPGAVSVMTRRNPKGELPLCQAIFTAGSITYPAHTGHILCLFTNVTDIEGC